LHRQHKQTIKERLDGLLKQEPPHKPLRLKGCLEIDGTWNHRQWCLLVYRTDQNKIACWRFAKGERYDHFKEDLEHLKQAGYTPKVIISDGKASILKAIREVFPKTPQQRCLFHIVHQASRWLTQKPKTAAAQTSRVLVDTLISVKTKQAAQAWNEAFEVWQLTFDTILKERSFITKPSNSRKKWWYTHRNLRRTWKLLNNAQPYLWTFLNYASVPRTTSILEGATNASIKDLLELVWNPRQK